MHRQGWRAVFVAMAVLCALPVGASAATRTVKGKTSQGLRASAKIREDNSVARVSVKYRARCRKRGEVRGGIFWQDSAGERGFERNGESFSDGGRFRVRQRRFRAAIDSKMTGAPASGGGWAGKFSVVVRVKNRRNRTIDVCKTRSRSWRVGAPTG